MDEIMSLGIWVKRRRKALDLTQDALARQVGCSLELIRKIEGDTRRPSRQVAERLAAASGLKVLATSREILHLRGEKEFAVLPLALPPQEPRTEN